MRRVMIVDDEPAHRIGLAHHVDWPALGCEAPLMAEDAEEALFLASREPVDVVIADVCMPGMDGIALVRELRGRNPDLQVLIISGFEEFEFARGAVEAGAAAYLLKPLKMDEVSRWMRTFIERIDAREGRLAEEAVLKAKLRDSQNMARKRFLEELVREAPVEADHAGAAGELDRREQRLVMQARQLDLPIGSGLRLICAAREVGGGAVTGGGAVAGGDAVASGGAVVGGGAEDGAFPGAESVTNPSRMTRDLKTIATRLEGMLGALPEAVAAIAVETGDEVVALLCVENGGRNGGETNQKRETALPGHFVALSGHSGALPDASAPMPGLAALLKERLSPERLTLRVGEPVQLWTELQTQYRLHREERLAMRERENSEKAASHEKPSSGAPQATAASGAAISGTATSGTVTSGTATSGPVTSGTATSGPVASDSLAPAEPRPAANAPVSRTVKEALRLLSEHLSDGLTVEELAERVHMNASYLSVLFKKETGETISDHVARLRIDQARQLLLGGRKISDVAGLVGYRNASFFARQFQRAVGVSPAEYRRYGAADSRSE